MPEPQQERTAVTSKGSKRTISQDSHENLRSQDNIIKSTAVESVDLAGRKVLAALQGHWHLKHGPPALASVLWQGCQIFQQKAFSFFFFSHFSFSLGTRTKEKKRRLQSNKKTTSETHDTSPTPQDPILEKNLRDLDIPQWRGKQFKKNKSNTTVYRKIEHIGQSSYVPTPCSVPC